MPINKLNEIEATNNILMTGASRTDVELLIRAVRQLGTRKNTDDEKWIRLSALAASISDVHPSITRAIYKILDEPNTPEDPDVLELISEHLKPAPIAKPESASERLHMKQAKEKFDEEWAKQKGEKKPRPAREGD